MPVAVLLADEYAFVRKTLRRALEGDGFLVVAETADGSEAVRLVEEHRPDIALLSLTLPRLNGLDAARAIVRRSPRTRPVLLTVHTEQAYAREAFRVGVRGLAVKGRVHDVVEALRTVARGDVYGGAGVSGSPGVPASEASESPPEDPLTTREREVLRLAAEGHKAKAIASALGISVKTVEAHRGNIMKKLSIHDTAGLVRYAIRQGLIRP